MFRWGAPAGDGGAPLRQIGVFAHAAAVLQVAGLDDAGDVAGLGAGLGQDAPGTRPSFLGARNVQAAGMGRRAGVGKTAGYNICWLEMLTLFSGIAAREITGELLAEAGLEFKLVPLYPRIPK